MKRYWLATVAAGVVFVAAGFAQAAGDVAAGQALSKKCAACHGKMGEGKKKNPSIAGLDEAAFVKSMHDYKSGARKNAMMKMSVKKLSDQDMANLAAYYATLKK